MSLLNGQLLEGKYLIRDRIAEGGMSTVYLAVNERIGKTVAVKVLRSDVARDRDNVERFEREARIVSLIRSPHIADVYDSGKLPGGAQFMVMEYLEGESLATILERERTLSSRKLAMITAQVLDALSAAHASGVVHRDLKPENIIITTTHTNEMVVKLVDFGIAKIIERPGAAERLKLTDPNAVLGTPLYMSPEQARGVTTQIDHRTDLYALGVILYEATCGVPPLTGENVNDLLFRIVLDDPTPLEGRVPWVDPALVAIVDKALAKNPCDRWSSADEMRKAVNEWLSVLMSAPNALTLVDDDDDDDDDDDEEEEASPPSTRTLTTPMTLVFPIEPARERSESLSSESANSTKDAKDTNEQEDGVAEEWRRYEWRRDRPTHIAFALALALLFLLFLFSGAPSSTSSPSSNPVPKAANTSVDTPADTRTMPVGGGEARQDAGTPQDARTPRCEDGVLEQPGAPEQ